MGRAAPERGAVVAVMDANAPEARAAQRRRYAQEQRKKDAPQPSKRLRKLVERWLRTYDDYLVRGGKWTTHLSARRALVSYGCRHGDRSEDLDGALSPLYDLEPGADAAPIETRILYRIARLEATENEPTPF